MKSRIRGEVVAWLGLLVTGTVPGTGSAAVPPIPAGLPKYDLQLTIDPKSHTADFQLLVTWTNRTSVPTQSLVLNFYPHYEIPPENRLLLAKTLELLRLHPSYGMDVRGKHGILRAINLLQLRGRPGHGGLLPYHYQRGNSTAIVVDLPEAIAGGESVTLELLGNIRLANKQGRWGHWDGVTYLTNALPVVAYYDRDGWHETPFVPWHQPFWNEAGIYTATIRLPRDHLLACSATVDSESIGVDGFREVRMKPFVGRDFAVVCSQRFQLFESAVKLPDERTVQLRCLAFPEHAYYAKEILRIASEALPVYSRWFGAYPYDQFTIVESFFGWNGNECSGMILIDERVFGMPHTAVGYAEYLVSHETCHQWWYNLVGTNGYSETFMDEGAATYFTHRFLDRKLGKNNAFLNWPRGLAWLPNIQRENYRYASYQGAIRRGDAPAAAGDLPEFGHLIGLFSGAYDRGSKVFGMIEHRLGEAAFFDFIQGVVKKYSFEVLTAATFRQELESYTGQPWVDFFERWVYGKDLTDWAIVSVTSHRQLPSAVRAEPAGIPRPHPRRVEVVLEQKRELDEATVVGFQFAEGDGYPVRIPVGPSHQEIRLAEYQAEVVPLGPGKVRVQATLPEEPIQVAVDPEGVLIDANPGNNRWKNPPRVQLVPFYSMLNETDLTNDYDRWNFGAGPWLGGALYPDPWYTRSTMIGVRAGAYRTQVFTGGVYVAARTDYRDLVFGVDGLLDHWPWPRTQVGWNFERRLAGPIGIAEKDHSPNRAVVFGRYVFEYGSSLYLPPISYADLYSTYQDNFLPVTRTNVPGVIRPNSFWVTGLHYRLNLYTPYWDPERGIWLDLAYAGGVADLESTVGTHQLRGEFAAVRALPIEHPYLSAVKAAGRLVLWGAVPDRGQFFALGGGTLYRGFDLAERQGSFLWVVNSEIRWPLAMNVRWDALDHFVGVRDLYLASFYDVGAIYAHGKSVGGVAHALGMGLRADLAIFSFIERAVVRFDVGKTINAATPIQFWFGIQHAF